MNTPVVSEGKFRALQRATTRSGHFTVLALDHQDALRRAVQPSAPESVTPERIVGLKQQIVGALAPECSGVLLDPLYGAAQAIAAGSLGSTGLLVELEKADYQLRPMPLNVELLPQWSVAKIKRAGADGVKLFYYDNPDSPALTAAQDAVVRRVGDQCADHDIPFYAEPILCEIGEPPAQYAEEFTRRVIESAQRAAHLGADVLKLEFPVHPSLQPDVQRCRNACAHLTESLGRPWVLLSAGVSFDALCTQLEIACAAGASGYIVGRAVWGEVVALPNEAERQRWLETTGRERLQRLAQIVTSGRPWTAVVQCEPVTPQWYATYAEAD